MASISVSNAQLGNALQDLLMAPDIEPGDDVSYQTCKTIYESHPLGAKIADNPIQMAQSQRRQITVQKGPEERLVEAFEAEWKALGVDGHILNLARLARIYGHASVAMLERGKAPNSKVNFDNLAAAQIAFNVLDPLNTAGSLLLNQDPNSLDFQKVAGISVDGKAYARDRTCTLLHEDPLYIAYTSSAFGYSGRSVYKRALFPLKSFINTQITNDMVAAKAGLLVVHEKQQSSAIDGLMQAVAGVKRQYLKDGQVGQVLQVGSDDTIESLDLHNLADAFNAARKNILEDIASAAGTPAQVINSETFAEGFGEGTEDAKRVAQYIQRIREWMDPAYEYFTKIVQHRAWNPEFYATIQVAFPKEYGGVDYKAALYEWQDNFRAEWPSLIEEPDSEKSKVDDVRLKGLVLIAETVLPILDPENKAEFIQTLYDNINAMKMVVTSPFKFDGISFQEYVPLVPETTPGETEEPDDLSAKDSVALLPNRQQRRLTA